MARLPLGPADEPSFIGRNVMQALANHAEAGEAIGRLAAAGYLCENLAPVHRELAYLGASTVNGCHY